MKEILPFTDIIPLATSVSLLENELFKIRRLPSSRSSKLKKDTAISSLVLHNANGPNKMK